MEAKKIIERYHNALVERDRFKQLYEAVYDYTMPDRYMQVEDTEDSSGSETRLELYTSVPEQSADRFVQKLQGLLTPIGSNWIGFEAGYAYTAGDSEPVDINKNLQRIAKICNVFKDVSNFDSEITSFYYDLVAGTAYLMVKEGTANNPLVFKTIPFKEVAIEEGLDGVPDHYYREFKLKNEKVKEAFPDAKYSFETGKEDEEICLLEATYKEKDMWNYVVIKMDGNEKILEKKLKTSPFICLRWTKSSREVYGRGCGLKALNDIRTLNKIKEYSLKALALSVPVFTSSEDGDYSPENFRLVPGAINPVPSNLNNNPTIRQVSVVQQPDIQQYQATEIQMDIKRNMFDITIPNDPTNMTATEINQRTAELANQLNNSFGRLINEFLYPLVKRIVNILQNFGYIDEKLDVNNFNGFGYKIKINTNLSNQQKAEQLNSIISFFSVMASLDPTLSFTSRLIDLNKIGIEVARLSGVPFEYIRSDEEMQAMEQQQAQAIVAQQQQAMADDVAIANAKEEGKANAQQRASGQLL